MRLRSAPHKARKRSTGPKPHWGSNHRSALWRQMPRMGGKELDLHKLYRSVTMLGGCAKVTADKKWRVRGLTTALASMRFAVVSAGA